MLQRSLLTEAEKVSFSFGQMSCSLVDAIILNYNIAALRIPLGDAQILNFFLNVVAAEGVHLNLMSQALRLIGNACADTGLPALCSSFLVPSR